MKHDPSCSYVGFPVDHEMDYSDEWNCFFCSECNNWLEEKRCCDRPDKPFPEQSKGSQKQ